MENTYEELSHELQLRVDDYVNACEKIFEAIYNPTTEKTIWHIVAQKLAEKDLYISIC